MSRVERVAVLVCTYRRPELLSRLLESLANQELDRPWDVVVVDNDPAASAREVATQGPLSVRYVVEERPGIAAARNRALQEAGDVDTVVLVDDDETADPGWLAALVATCEREGADVVTGPVVSVLSPGAPRWFVRGGFTQRRNLPEGTRLRTAKSGNTLVRTAVLGEARFDESFSRSGGSDSDLFWRLAAKGARIVWCHDAVVRETVPPERQNLRWVVRRDLRGGVVMGRIMMREQPRLLVLAKGLVRACVGLARVVLGTLVHLGPRASDVKVMLFGAGLAASTLGWGIDEYGRGPRT